MTDLRQGLVASLALTGALLLSLAGTVATSSDAEAQMRRPGMTTSKTATRRKPSGSRSRYSNRLTSRQAGKNTSTITTRSSANRSAFGDGRRNGVRLSSSPIPSSATASNSQNSNRSGVRMVGSPVTSWSGWNRAVRQQAAAQPQRRQRTSRGGMRVRFRSAGRRR